MGGFAVLAVLTLTITACASDVSEPGGLPLLQIVVNTDGVELDPDGYELRVGSQPPVAVGVVDTVGVHDVPFGQTTVRLEGLAINCAVRGENPTDLDVDLFGNTARFDVECIPNEGDVEVNIEVTGPVHDPSGFVVSLGDAAQLVTETPEVLMFTNVRGGDQEIAFDDLASYCSVVEGASVRVLPGTVTTVDLTVRCVYSVEGRVLFSVLTSEGWRLHTVAPDGRDLVPFGDHEGLTENQQRPSISIDGSRIVFTYGADSKAFYAIDPDGTNMRPIPGGSGLTPKISPAGERIAFSADREIWVMDFDGSNRIQVTDGLGFSHSPDWSPDGERLAFEVQEGSDWNLYTVNVDGTDLTPITTDHADDDLDPDYRPDGARLAFHSKRDGPKIVTTAPDGSDLVETVDVGWDPAWSPDGGRIVYHVDLPYPVGIYVVDVATGDVTWLSASLPGVRAVHAAWGPPLP